MSDDRRGEETQSRAEETETEKCRAISSSAAARQGLHSRSAQHWNGARGAQGTGVQSNGTVLTAACAARSIEGQ